MQLGQVSIGNDAPLFLMAGPCVIESEELVFEVAETLLAVTQRLGIPYVFKASFDKANRSSAHSYRGVGLEKGLAVFEKLKQRLDVMIVTDVHTRTHP